jgi:hypothetical protein
MTVTLSAADFELSTRSASGFILKYIAPRLEPVMLYGPLARRFPFTLSAPHSDVIIAVGHGDYDQVNGQNDAVILKVGEYNDNEIQNKVIYAFSCLSAAGLGPDLINHGATAFLGWNEDYLWEIDESQLMTPWRDKLAAPCMMPVIDGLNALLDGKTVSQVHQIQMDSYDKWASMADVNMDGTVNETDEIIKDLVQFNQSNFVLYGDPQARISPRPPLSFLFRHVSPPPLLMPV